jgi:hypothetical protein
MTKVVVTRFEPAHRADGTSIAPPSPADRSLRRKLLNPKRRAIFARQDLRCKRPHPDADFAIESL